MPEPSDAPTKSEETIDQNALVLRLVSHMKTLADSHAELASRVAALEKKFEATNSKGQFLSGEEILKYSAQYL